MIVTVDSLLNRYHNTIADPLPTWYRRVLLRDVCVYCGGEPTGLDHIEPRASYVAGRNSRRHRRWMHSWQNRAPACSCCDAYKTDTPLLLFLVTIQNGLPAPTPRQYSQQQRLAVVQRRLKMETV